MKLILKGSSYHYTAQPVRLLACSWESGSPGFENYTWTSSFYSYLIININSTTAYFIFRAPYHFLLYSSPTSEKTECGTNQYLHVTEDLSVSLFAVEF